MRARAQLGAARRLIVAGTCDSLNVRTTRQPPDGAAAAPIMLVIRVQPASSRTSVGGRRGDALVVKVTQPAVDGRATEAALAALAQALGVRRRAVRLLRGATSRDKAVAVEHSPADAARLTAVLAELRSAAR
jgi:uncharacterized protein YggU (UPF0235/DUF167 family)